MLLSYNDNDDSNNNDDKHVRQNGDLNMIEHSDHNDSNIVWAIDDQKSILTTLIITFLLL